MSKLAKLCALPLVDRYSLTVRQIATLDLICTTHAGKSVMDVADTLNIGRPSVSRALDKLGDAGFVTRAQDGRDHRKIVVQPTAQGRALHRSITAALAG